MVTGAETMGSGLIVDAGDDRITKVGGLLRRTSLDELPNLINVLRGEMSLVGPRPTVQVQVDRYTERQRPARRPRPGITGWAQVNGRASLPWHERIELDLATSARLAAARPLISRRASGWCSRGTGSTAGRPAAGASARGWRRPPRTAS